MKQYKSVAVLIYYFGKFPWYFPYFLHSSKFNATIDFFIITDNDIPNKIPENIFFIKKTLRDVKKLMEEKLGLKVAVTPIPYKLCDFRPAFGTIFYEYIEKYDFWGHGDLDVIFGNIRNFISDEILNEYEIICLRPDYISSWFALYKNSEKINYLFKKSIDYEKIFTTSKYYNFDETNFTFKEFADGIVYKDIESEIESMTHLVKRLCNESFIKAYFDLHVIEGCTGKIKWNRGQLIYRRKYEILLYHLIGFKKIFKPKYFRKVLPNSFYISPTNIYFKKN